MTFDDPERPFKVISAIIVHISSRIALRSVQMDVTNSK